MDNIPAVLGDPAAEDYLDGLLVVGATSRNGISRWDKSSYDDKKGLPHVYAAGENVLCPDTEIDISEGLYRESSGTSPATAATAGLAAYFLSLADKDPFQFLDVDISTPRKLKEHIIAWSYSRSSDPKLNVIYNGHRPSDMTGTKDRDGASPACSLRPVRRRQLDLNGEISEDFLPDFDDCGPAEVEYKCTV